MKVRPIACLTVAYLVILLGIRVMTTNGGAPARAATVLPDTTAGKRVAAYLEAFNGGEARMKEFFLANVSPESLAMRPVEERLRFYREVQSETGGLALRQVVQASETGVTILAQAKAGGWFELTFQFEPAPPHRLEGFGIDEAEPPDPNAPPAPQTIAGLTGAIDQLLDKRVQSDEFSGVVLVARDGRPVYQRAVGLASREFQVPNRLDTKFNLGSINKIFTRIAVAQLAAAGKLSLDDPLGKWVPDYPNAEAREKVTIRHLLDMASGIGDFFGEKFEATPKDRLRTNADFLPLFAGEPLLFPPGSQRRYSNGGYIVLGAVIEKVSGQSYYDYVREHIFRPAGMADTDSYEADVPTPNLACGYTRRWDGQDRDSGPRRSNVYTRPARGSSAGGGYSTAEDLLKFSRALAENKLLPEAWTRWMLTGRDPQTPAPAAPAPRGGLGFAGGAPGINAQVELDLDSGWTVIVLSNYDPPSAQRVAKRIVGWQTGLPR
jgi:CubicO group peptidase (beta-lactamase class C family)